MQRYKEVLHYLRNRDSYSEEERDIIKKNLRERLDDFVDGVNFINKL